MLRTAYAMSLAFLAICFFAICAYGTRATAQVTFTQAAINSGDTTSSAITAGDFDRDGLLDLITVNNSSLSFYKGLGAGQYAAPVNQTLPNNLGQVLAGDFNRDGKLDLAIAT